MGRGSDARDARVLSEQVSSSSSLLTLDINAVSISLSLIRLILLNYNASLLFISPCRRNYFLAGAQSRSLALCLIEILLEFVRNRVEILFEVVGPHSRRCA